MVEIEAMEKFCKRENVFFTDQEKVNHQIEVNKYRYKNFKQNFEKAQILENLFNIFPAVSFCKTITVDVLLHVSEFEHFYQSHSVNNFVFYCDVVIVEEVRQTLFLIPAPNEPLELTGVLHERNGQTPDQMFLITNSNQGHRVQHVENVEEILDFRVS